MTNNCLGHNESVTNVKFNKDSSLLATGDMSGLLQVWNVAKGELFWDFEVDQIQVCVGVGLSVCRRVGCVWACVGGGVGV